MVGLQAAMTTMTHAQGGVIGEVRQWHTITLAFTGPSTDEMAALNPFTDYRLDVTFRHAESGATITVPGFYAADGDAANTSAAAGDQWHVRFSPDRVGVWNWTASFRTGPDVAMAEAGAGEPAAFDGAMGVLDVLDTDKAAPDFRARGKLMPVGERYLRFAGDGTRFIKTGTDSPENFLAYAGFDGTEDHGWDQHGLVDGLHQYLPHVGDWNEGDPTWGDGEGKGIIGAVNYLASEGVNSIYFLTLNAHGDGNEVYPWVEYPSAQPGEEVLRFDVSKLEQWNIVFTHMTSRGVMLHVVLQENENNHLLDGGDLGPQRRLYFRELIARFAHHPALVWNLGEENTNTAEQRAAFAHFFEENDPYGHPVSIHSYPAAQGAVFTSLLGNAAFDGPSLQGNPINAHSRAKYWLDASAEAGRQWFVCQDEVNPADVGVTPDPGYPGFDGPDNHDTLREQVLWGNLMAGGAGVEWYFGYGSVQDDLNCEDFRSRDAWWDYSRIARLFFEEHVPFERMRHADDLLSTDAAFALAERDGGGAVVGPVLVYLRSNWSGGTLNLSGPYAEFHGRWFNPRTGVFSGTVTLTAAGAVSVPLPPTHGEDWALLLRPADQVDCDGNGITDLDEIASDPTLDCNSNGLLDACETDCNEDGVPDDCEIARDGDCNGNGVPDACDIRAGILADCDGNGVADACQTTGDCNGNGIPDACERNTAGLLGEYYRNQDLAGTPELRIDPRLDFDWDVGAPFAHFPQDKFSARWTGSILTPPGESGLYTFHVHTNDGVRLWVDDVLLIDQWRDHMGVHLATIELTGGAAYPFRVEHYEGTNTARLRVQWTRPSGVFQIIPASVFSLPDVGCHAADLNGDEIVDVHDLLIYLDLFFQNDPVGDHTGDGVVDVFDLLLYLDSWFGA